MLKIEQILVKCGQGDLKIVEADLNEDKADFKPF